MWYGRVLGVFTNNAPKAATQPGHNKRLGKGPRESSIPPQLVITTLRPYGTSPLRL
jgi:hypothetical protein